MKLTVLGSGSNGNCYILDNGKQALMIECGISFAEVEKAMDFDIDRIVGCVVTHEHGDHCKYHRRLEKIGIPIFTGARTAEKIGLKYKFPMSAGQVSRIGDFFILPFDVVHNAVEPFGFLINHKECGTILFATDLGYSPYKFEGLNHILLECNYSDEILASRAEKGSISRTQLSHVIEGHLSLKTCSEILEINDLSEVKNIVLLHLSDLNSNAAQFKETIQNLTGKPTYIAEKGFTLNIAKSPF